MSGIVYFAYGSNMLSARLLARCPSARVLGPASAIGREVAFSKLSVDLSAKAALVERPGAVVHGVAYELDVEAHGELDAIEGPGYFRQSDFPIALHRGTATIDAISASAYHARRHVAGRLPYDWYLDLIVAGGREHGLPAAYIERLLSSPTMPDPDPFRPTAREARELLQNSDFHQSADSPR